MSDAKRPTVRAWKTNFAVALCLALVGSRSLAADPGLLAWYRFDEGHGDVLGDSSGRGNEAAIHGARWAPCGNGFALRFDGVDDYVDCGNSPSLNPSAAVTVEAWLCPDGIPGAGEAGTVGKCYDSFFLTYYTDGNCWWYVGNGGSSIRAAVPAGTWHHVVGTFDGGTSRLYVDGEVRGSRTSNNHAISAGGPFFLGTSSGDSHYTKGFFYRGMMAEVRVYDRALSADEVARHYGTTRITGEIAMRPYLYPAAGTLAADLDLRALGELPAKSQVTVRLLPEIGDAPLAQDRIVLSPSQRNAEVTFKLRGLAPGPYRLQAHATDSLARQIGLVTELDVRWPEPLTWKEAPQARVLNNLVAELFRAESPTATAFSFTNPRVGWVFVASETTGGATAPISVSVDGSQLHRHENAALEESMRLLSKGEHRLTLSSAGNVKRLVVRSIPELIFAKYGPEIVLAKTRARAQPHRNEAVNYDWQFLHRHVLPNVNVMIGTGGPDQEPMLAEWKREGKRWLVECGAVGFVPQKPVTAGDVQAYLAGHAGFANPRIDGVIVDEFGGGEQAAYEAWTEALRWIRADGSVSGKLIYPYCAPMYGAKASSRFIQAVMDAGSRFAFERYLPEQRGEAATRAYLDAALPATIDAWRRAMPGAEQHMIVCMGTFSQPPESLDVNPAIDYRVYLDRQLNILANDPRCFGLYGVMTYLSSYTEPEIVCWMGKLFRHYCIEGRNEPYTRDPLVLGHVANGDFEQGLAGWQVEPAEAGSVEARTREGFSWLQGRYPMTNQGNTVLWMKRSASKPNTVRQKVRALEPGRLYTLRMVSGDGQDLSIQQQLSLSVRLDGAEVLPGRARQDVFPNCYSHHYGPFDREHLAWMSYQWIPFRAAASDATLVISDWTGPDTFGGPVGQEIVLNYVQVQPFDP